jgi:hypothetical protein
MVTPPTITQHVGYTENSLCGKLSCLVHLQINRSGRTESSSLSDQPCTTAKEPRLEDIL